MSGFLRRSLLTSSDDDTPGVNRVRRSVTAVGRINQRLMRILASASNEDHLNERSQPNIWAKWPTVVDYCGAYNSRRRTF